MLEVEILEPLHALAGPSALEPRQSLGVEVDGPAGAIAGPSDRLVRERQRDEDADRKGQPPRARHAGRGKSRSPEQASATKNDQPGVGDAAVALRPRLECPVRSSSRRL